MLGFCLLIHVTIQIYLVITFKNTENTCLFVLWIKTLFGLMKGEGKKKKEAEEERNDFPLFG